MKFCLAILSTFIALHLSAQQLQFAYDTVNLDTIPMSTVRSGEWIWKHHQARFWCACSGDQSIRIDSVYEYRDGQRWTAYRSKFTAWPDECVPGQQYEVLFDVTGEGVYRFEFVTNTRQRISVWVKGARADLAFAPKSAPPFYEQEQEGRVHETVAEIVNVSGRLLVVDSIVATNQEWVPQSRGAIQLQPGEHALIRFRNFSGPYVTNSSSNLHFYVFHHAQGELNDVITGTVYLNYYHAVRIQGNAECRFGRVTEGQLLTAKVIVRNAGTAPYDLQKNARAGVTFDREVLDPGDSATATVNWHVNAASDSFRMEIPLLSDVRNGACTVVFRGVVGNRWSGPERSVNPDSMIWIETNAIDLDTLYRSQGTLYREIVLRNNSGSSIRVTRASTGDGGSYAEAPRDTIAPGEEFKIRFVQDLRSRIGMFNRTLYIQILYLDGTDTEIAKMVSIRGYVVNDLAQ